MNQETGSRQLFSKKKLSFLLPAVLTGVLVFELLPQTQVDLREIPQRMQLVEEVLAETQDQEKPAIQRREQTDDEDGQTAVGHYEDGVYTGSAQGYGGLVTVEVTVKDGQIVDVKIVSAPGETDPYFSLAKSVIEQVKQQQTWEVDTVSGATYSSRGILGAVQNALTGETVENAPAPKVEPKGTKQQDSFTDPKAYKDGTYTGTAQGFGGPITVKVTIKDGKITDISIVSASGETASYLNSARGVISKILKKGSPNVDTVSGATYSSTGIINAVKRALSKASADGNKSEKTKEKKIKKPKATPSAKATTKQDSYQEPSAYRDGTYYGTADGFGGEIKVKVVISGGKLTSISIEDASGETTEYFNKAKAVINAMLKKGSPNVDTISGATYSSTGIINAVKRAMSQAAASGETNPGKAEQNSGAGQTETPADPDVMPKETLKDGTYTGTGVGYGGDVTVQMTVSGGRMTEISVISAEKETPAYFNRAKAITGTILNRQSADVDVVSGATYSSEGILDAVKNAIAEAAKTDDPQEEKPGSDIPGGDTPGGSGTGGGAEAGGDAQDSAVKYKDGTYTERGWCIDDYGDFEYEVIVSITIQDQAIKKCNVSFGEDYSEYPEDNDYYIDRAVNGTARTAGIPKQVVTKQSAEVDIVGGATYTSTTIKQLVASILSKCRDDSAVNSEESVKKAKTSAAVIEKEQPEVKKDLEDPSASDRDVPSDTTSEKSADDSETTLETGEEMSNQEEQPGEQSAGEDRKEEAPSETEQSKSAKKTSQAASAEDDAVTTTKQSESEAKKKAEEDAKKKSAEEERRAAEAAKKKAEAEAKKKAEEEKKKAEEAAKAKAAEEAAQKAKAESDKKQEDD